MIRMHWVIYLVHYHSGHSCIIDTKISKGNNIVIIIIFTVSGLCIEKLDIYRIHVTSYFHLYLQDTTGLYSDSTVGSDQWWEVAR